MDAASVSIFFLIHPKEQSRTKYIFARNSTPVENLNVLECPPEENSHSSTIGRSSPREPTFLLVKLARDLKYFDVKAQQVVSSCPRCGVSRFKPHTVTQAGARRPRAV